MDQSAIQRLIHTFNRFTVAGEPGINRLTLTHEDREARDYLKTYMEKLGMEVLIDPIGNMIGIRPGTEDLPLIATGSHLDSVKQAGSYDGTIGIIAGLAVIEYLNQYQIQTRHPIAVINFTNEEGVRFTPDMMGSYVFSGKGNLETMYASQALDDPEITVRSGLETIGYLGDTEIGSIPLAGFIELHIEQGRVLEDEGLDVGIVEKVQGIYWTAYHFEGEANHAGTTPMHFRKDAGYAAARMAVYARELAEEVGDPQVITAGRIAFNPNVTNIVAGKATLSIDNRYPESEQIQETQAQLDHYARKLAEELDLILTIEPLVRFEPVNFDQEIINTLTETAEKLRLSHKHMISGAGHAAQMVALTYPAAMVFVPSKDGISHNPAEFTALEHIEQGIQLIREAVLALARRSE